MIITVRTTDTDLLEELKINFPSKYEFFMRKSLPVEYIAINNLHDTEDIHIDYDEAYINDGKIIEKRTRRLYTIYEFKKLHAIALNDNDRVEIEFIDKNILKNTLI